MKKEALELVRKIYQQLKWDIPHPNLEEIFEASKNQAKFVAQHYIDKNPKEKEKYEMLIQEIVKIEFKQVYA